MAPAVPLKELTPAGQPPAAINSPVAASTATGTVTPEPTPVPPAMDAGSVATSPQVSDSSLDPLITAAVTPARAASLRLAEKARVAIDQGRDDDAIRDLGYAVSIDPSNPYAYFYLGRAYAGKKDFGQAVTFFERAQVGLAADPVWLGEAYAFEGRCYEEAGKPMNAVAAYRNALIESPGNLTARVGLTRLAAFAAAPAASPTAVAPSAEPAAGGTIPLAPASSPIPYD